VTRSTLQLIGQSDIGSLATDAIGLMVGAKWVRQPVLFYFVYFCYLSFVSRICFVCFAARRENRAGEIECHCPVRAVKVPSANRIDVRVGHHVI